MKNSSWLAGSLFRNRNFLIWLTGRNLSAWGDAIYVIALLWFVYQDTHSVVATAVVSAIQRLGNVLGGPLAGVYVDRWDRRRTMLGVTLVNMAVVLILAILAFGHVLTIWPIYAAVFVLSGIGMLSGPAAHSILSRILMRDELASGNGLLRSVGAANGFFSQSVGGLVVGAVGAAASFLIDAGSFTFALAGYWLLTLPQEPQVAPNLGEPAPRRRFWRDLEDGWTALRRDGSMLALAIWAFMGTLGGGAAGALLPVVVFRTLHGGPTELGMVEGASILGSVGGGLLTGWIAQRFSVGHVLVGSGAVMGFSLALFGVSHDLGLSLGVYALAGLGQTTLNSSFDAFFQATVPPELMGRTFGILGAIENSAGPPAAMAAGVLSGIWGPGPIMTIGGLWMAISGVLLIFNHRAMATRMAGITATPD